MSPIDADDSPGAADASERGPSSSSDLADGANEDFLFHLYRGSELLGDNRVHEAKEELEAALRLQPKDTKGQDLLAVVYFRLGLYPRAIQIYEELKRYNRKEAPLKLNLALCYLKTGQPALARKELDVLATLVRERGRVVTQRRLLREHWGESHEDDTHYLRVLVGRLRQKLGVRSLRERGVSPQSLSRIVAQARGGSMRSNPIDLSDQELEGILISTLAAG